MEGMCIAVAKMEKRNLSRPDETRTFDKGKLELVKVGGVTFGRATLQPGWKWPTSVKPLVKTKSCQLLMSNTTLPVRCTS